MYEQKRMVKSMVRLHRANVNAADQEIRELEALESQIKNIKLTHNLRTNDSSTRADELNANGFL